MLNPTRLEDLFAVFDRLDRGESSVLKAPVSASPEASVCAEHAAEVQEIADARLGLYSSGTTGQPKIIWRSWTDLKAELASSSRFVEWTWASPFYPWSYAGVQVALHAWAGSRKVVTLGAGWTEDWALLETNKVDALSCTPTFIDLLLQQGPQKVGSDGGALPGEKAVKDGLRQITLGGEVLRAGLGQRLREAFPRAHFTVIYATAELGVLLKTRRLDGWYESVGLGRRDSDWRIQGGLLEVKRKGNWLSTGDLAETRDDLVRVIGRGDQVANVGGTKVPLDEIAALAEQVPGVRRAIAVTEPSPVTGQVVCLRFAVRDGYDPAKVTNDLQDYLRSRLRKEAWPRRWEQDEVGLGPNFKGSLVPRESTPRRVGTDSW